jgi:hypothetical protein
VVSVSFSFCVDSVGEYVCTYGTVSRYVLVGTYFGAGSLERRLNTIPLRYCLLENSSLCAYVCSICILYGSLLTYSRLTTSLSCEYTKRDYFPVPGGPCNNNAIYIVKSTIFGKKLMVPPVSGRGEDCLILMVKNLDSHFIPSGLE